MSIIFKESSGNTGAITSHPNNLAFEKYPNTVMQEESIVIEGDAIPGEASNSTIEVNISEKEALDAAQKMLKEMKLDDFKLTSSKKARIVKENFNYDILSNGWQFNFNRSDAGYYPVDYYYGVEGLFLGFYNEEEYSESWLEERMTIYVDETGVAYFSWNYPLEVAGTINENVQLMPFDKLQDSIKNAMKFSYAKTEDGFLEIPESRPTNEIVINIYKMVLTTSVQPIKNDTVARMTVPVWVLYYEHEGFDIYGRPPGREFYFAVNAIDGSPIDLSRRMPDSVFFEGTDISP